MNSVTKGISFSDMTVGKGFWSNKQDMISETTIYAIWDRFKETGRFDAFNFDWKEGMPNQPHIFWESDFAKWAEAVAYILAKKQDKKLEAGVDEIVNLIEKHQDENGYFNIYFTVVEPDGRFKHRWAHELYCAGHLIEGAVAYYKATGKDKFLKLMIKYADHIEKVFTIDHSSVFSTCGHPEIELALVKLYYVTGEKRYLKLAKFFVDSRGVESIDHLYVWDDNAYFAQDHLPARKQSTAEGHCVRGIYLYCGMADIAREFGDRELFDACRRIFVNIATRRMYITGGVGSSAVGEAFTIDYDLPNLTAYTESCGAIALTFFARRMLDMDVDSLYSDITERALYNGFLSSISLDGKSFFYENPLEIHPELLERDVCINKGKTRLPIIQRKGVFDTSCCPPNISRLIASIGDLVYSYDENTLYVHHYIPGKTEAGVNGKKMEVVQVTRYPLDGNISVTTKGSGVSSIAFRVPYWCEEYSFKVNGKEAQMTMKKGYAYISLPSEDTNTIDILFAMKVQLVEASPDVQEDAGRVAVQRGPVVYCLEAVDNGDLLRDVRIDTGVGFELIQDDAFGVPLIRSKGFRRKKSGFEMSLYRHISGDMESIDLKFIPYFGFANRGESEMVVWILKK